MNETFNAKFAKVAKKVFYFAFFAPFAFYLVKGTR